MTTKKRLLFIVPHLSTGGLPQVALKKIENLINFYDLMVIEYDDITAGLFTVQKNKIKSLLQSNKFITLGNNKKELISVIEKFQPNYIHLEEVPESFIDFEIIKRIYKKDRDYFITETTHNVLFEISNKKFLPDKFMHVSKYIAKRFEILNVEQEIIEYPIEKKDKPNREEKLKELGLDPEYKHVLNVGLFTPGKNQKEVIETARLLQDEKIQFHFVGNQAGNFQHYWEPLMKDLPKNCKIWGERSDVDNFYSCMDLFFFTSTYELNPIVIKEALSYDMKILMYNLEPYDGEYNNNINIKFLTGNIMDNVALIKNIFSTTQNILPKRCYITHTTKNYRYTAFGLTQSIIEYSDYPIVIFTINFNINDVDNPFINNNKVIFIEYKNDFLPSEAVLSDTIHGKYVDRSKPQTYKILSTKAKVLLKAFDLGVKDGVYLDSDSVARYNVDDLMNYIKDVEDYPLFTRGVYDIMLGKNGEWYIEKPAMDYFGVKERSMNYVQSNILVFTNRCINFIKEWIRMCDDENVLKNFETWAPFQDETIANILLWKYNYKNHLPMLHFNIRNLIFVKEFEKFDDTDKSKYSEHMQGFPFYIDGKQMEWSYIPYNKEDVKVFHGIKKYEEMLEIIKYQNRLKNDICMIQICDELYKPIADITSKVNKEYCDLYGYDYICYTDRIVDDGKTSHWQRYPAIKRHLRNYKWVFFLDIDAMIMNYNIRLEDLIDNNYDIIMENIGDSTDFVDEINKKYVDRDYNPIASAILFKNSKLSYDFLTDVYNNILNCNNLQYDNSSVRCVIGYFDKYKKATKLFPVDSKILNAHWYTNKPSYIFYNGPKWNDNGNMFKIGDFIIHITAYDLYERVSLLKQFLPYIIKE